jgi:hypothetical protein
MDRGAIMSILHAVILGAVQGAYRIFSVYSSVLGVLVLVDQFETHFFFLGCVLLNIVF